MLYVARLISAFLFIVLLTPVGLLLCLLRPFHPQAVYWVSRPLAWLCPWFGLAVQVRGLAAFASHGACVLVCNHQSNLDVLVCANILDKQTVTLGKKSLIWIPVFGLFYWLTGNIMIDRNNKIQAASTLENAAAQIKRKQLKVWIFPEGTRSYGRGLLPFKTGAFRLAQQAGVPIIPVCVAELHQVDLNRFRKTTLPIEILPARKILPEDDPRQIANEIHQQMAATIARLTQEALEIS